jgi:adenosine/AMP kinase
MINLHNLDQQDALFFLNLFSVIFPLHISNRVTLHQDVVTVYAAYGVDHIH